MEISTFFIILSSLCALPIPYYFIKDSTLKESSSYYREEVKTKFEKAFVIYKAISFCLIIFLISFGISKLIFFLSDELQALRVYALFFVLPIFLHMFYMHEFWFTKHETKINISLLLVILCLLVLPARDLILDYESNAVTPEIISENNKPLLSIEDIKIRFDFQEFKNSYYDSEISSYVHIGKKSKLKAIILVSSSNVTLFNCNFLPDKSLLRANYPNEIFAFQKIDFSDSNDVKAIYSIVKRDGIFKRPQEIKKISLSLKTGEVTDY